VEEALYSLDTNYRLTTLDNSWGISPRPASLADFLSHTLAASLPPQEPPPVSAMAVTAETRLDSNAPWLSSGSRCNRFHGGGAEVRLQSVHCDDFAAAANGNMKKFGPTFNDGKRALI
jgi:hypothetical protein